MATMYETIMDLPLLKGITHEQISQFLEKTNVQFLNYNKGDAVVSFGEPVTYIKFLIKGSVRVKHENCVSMVSVSETCGVGYVFALENMFGWETVYQISAVALESSSILQFRKDEYLSLLQTHPIYLMSLLNYLSVRVQRPVKAIKQLTDGSLVQYLGMWVNTVTSSSSEDIEIRTSREALHKLTNLSYAQIDVSLQKMKEKGLISYGRNMICVKSRMKLIESAFDGIK